MNTTEYRPNTRNTRKTVISLHPLDAYTREHQVEEFERFLQTLPPPPDPVRLKWGRCGLVVVAVSVYLGMMVYAISLLVAWVMR